MSVTARQKFAAARLGRAAAEAGKPVTACPFAVDGPDDAAVLAASWVKGYAGHPTTAGKVDFTG